MTPLRSGRARRARHNPARAAALGSLLVLAVVAPLLAACGSSTSSGTSTTSSASSTTTAKTVSASQYADSVCGSVSTWINDIKASSNSLQTRVKGASSLTEARAYLVDFLQSSVRATDKLIAEVDAAGQPNVSDAAQVTSTLDSALATVRSAFVDARNKAATLPVNNSTAFSQGATSLSTSISTQAQNASNALNHLSTGNSEINSAFNNSASCKQVANATAPTSTSAP